MAKKKKQEQGKIKLDLSISILDDMIRYIYSLNAHVSKKSLVKMRELFSILDDSVFESDRQMEVRVFLIRKLLEGRIDKRILDIQMLSNYVLGGQYDQEVLEIYADIDEQSDLSDDEVYFIDEYVSDRLEFAYIYHYEGALDNKILELRSGQFNSLGEFNDEFEEIIEELYAKMKTAKTASKHAAEDFGTDEESLNWNVHKVVDNLNRAGNKIKSGLKWMNAILRGGFQGGRAYLFLGFPKGWKSGMLLNVVTWAKKYNPNIVTKDPTKKPCILYVTQENSIEETTERLWSYYIGDDTEIKDYDPDVAAQMLSDAGFNDEGISIKIKYRPNRSINTADLDAMIDDLALEGYEVVMLVHDYIKRIRSIEKHTERHRELGAIMDEMTVIAKTRQIPVVTASQLNREAMKVAEGMQGRKANLAKNLGSSHTGESTLMLENADYVFLQAMEEKESTGKKYLTLKVLASRGKASSIGYFAHPFENGMRLEEDEGTAVVKSLADLGDDLGNYDPNAPKQGGEEGEEDSPRPNRNRKPSAPSRPSQVRLRPSPAKGGSEEGEKPSILTNMEIEV